MAKSKIVQFSPIRYLAAAGVTGKTMRAKAKHVFFAQGDLANCLYYLESGRARLVVVSSRGKEATVSFLSPGDFIGEESLAGVEGLRAASAIAVTACVALKIDRADMVRLLHEDHEFSDSFLKFVLTRAMRTQEDLVDQLFNNSEKRLARTLLLMAEFGQPGEPEMLIPSITQEALAEMIGTPRSRVSFFMNRFRKLGFIEYNGRIHVHKSLLNVVLHDRLPEQHATRIVQIPTVSDPDTKRKTVRKKTSAKLA
jgi:CRP/FNR family cyclic AMP-dependent transcriptional regulator